MKKLYLFTAAAALLLAFCGRAQNLQNANWYFGDHAGVTFLPNPATPTALNNSAMQAWEPCASVSDLNGQLLFYTNGWTVYNRIHQVMTNGFGLLGDLSNSQMAIVPRPGYPDRYYIIAMDGSSGAKIGLTHTEVDMAAGTYGEVIAQNKNIFFKDHNGVDINAAYNFQYSNGSEKVTTAKHCNGEDYWVIAQIRSNIYSYKVTSTGISNVPVVSAAYIGSDFTIGSNGLGNIKISPDSKRVAISYSSPDGGVMLGSFNNATGQITLDPTVISIGDTAYLRLEFSPSSQYVYFMANGFLYVTSAYSNTTTLIPTPSYYVGSIERALNGKLYLTYAAATPHQTHLAVLNDPDNPLNPGFQANAIDLSPAYQNGYANLPQWVHRHGAGCEDHIVLSIPEGNISHTYQYANYIQAQDNYKIVSSLQDITMVAGNHIVLKPDVYIANGSHYYGHIEDCGINQQRLAIALCQESQSQNENEAEERSATIDVTQLQVYPNPTTGLINFTGIQISEIYIFDLLGKDVYHSRFDNAYTASADISTLQKGIYMAKVIDSEGLIKTVKVIKE